MSQIHRPKLYAAVVVLLGPATGHAFEKCEPFVVVAPSDGRQIEFLDHGLEGASPGDVRVGGGPLVSESGDLVGEISWIATVVQPGEDGGIRQVSDGALMLPTGEILYKQLPGRSHRDPGMTPLSSAPAAASRIITGGSGVFAGGSGTIAWTRDENDHLTMSVDVTCD